MPSGMSAERLRNNQKCEVKMQKIHSIPPLPSKTNAQQRQSSNSLNSSKSNVRSAKSSKASDVTSRLYPGKVAYKADNINRAKEVDDRRRASNQNWVDRIANELQCQREWSDKWGSLVDPRLYSDRQRRCWEDKSAIKYSPFSVLKAPSGDPSGHVPPSSHSFVPVTDKITGNRAHYLTQQTTAGAASRPNSSSLSKGQRGVLPIGKRRKPAQVYGFPPTVNTEYGWPWGGVRTLEIYGSTSAKIA
ncbi:hypothetical protein DFJ77DRAFT_269207 [Powellomyces hirtus]|nr:hypothetical protein DFJ77DRAFT_269207 [Powellomyces hirtus]